MIPSGRILRGSVFRAGGDLRTGAAPGSGMPYGRLFGDLPAWRPPGGGDVEDYLWALAAEMFTDRVEDNPTIPAGYTYFGQLISHDLTFDANAKLQERGGAIASSTNLRTPRFDLDCVYGRGPLDQPYLYSDPGVGTFLIGSNERGELDLPRSQYTGGGKSRSSENPFNLTRPALIGDPRNDENIILSQLHLAVLRFHNTMMSGDFDAARRATCWHYQWVVIHDFLERLCTRSLVNEVLGSHGRPDLRFFDPRVHPFIPIEFSAGAYRCGHSMVRPDYSLSADLLDLRGAPLPIFAPIEEDSLVGGRVLPPGWTIQWSLFVEHSQGPDPQLSRSIGPHVPPAMRLLALPREEPQRLRSLAFRTLLRGWQMGLPSGQGVADRMGERVLAGNDPLWVYILREAAETGGRHLGPVGARIVAEVFIGLLAADPQSYLAAAPSWQPPSGADFDLAAFLTASGAPMSERDWKERPGA